MDRTIAVPIKRVPGSAGDDLVVVEEPLEIRVGDRPLSVTMRTPGDDFDLAVGFLFTEGLLRDPAEIESIRHWGSPNVVRVAVSVPLDLSKVQRHFYATSSCGICGKASIDAIRVQAPPIESAARIDSDVLARLPDALRTTQPAFDATGAIHAAAAFTAGGMLVRAREDVGRHNAVDKVIGSLFLEGRRAEVLVVSGRAGFEIVQKAVVAAIPIVVAVGAPSSLAVDLARESGQTLAGFVREGRFNVYSGGERIG